MTDTQPRPVAAPEPHVTATTRPDPAFAAIDLGSNSFNLLLCRWCDPDLQRLARCKQIVQLVRDVDCDGNLDGRSIRRALHSLAEFRELLDIHQPDHLDIIGTEALRKAPNAEKFLKAAETILGAPISIISNEREALLAYRGVQYYHQEITEPILVIDIGGASTELAVGKGAEIRHWHSLEMGCVSLASQFFQGAERCSMRDKIDTCYQHCRQNLDPQQQVFRSHDWQLALGASGIMRVIANLLDADSDEIQRAQIDMLLQRVATEKTLKDSIPSKLRRDILPAGMVLLAAIFDSFGFGKMTVSAGNVKQGLILERLQGLGFLRG